MYANVGTLSAPSLNMLTRRQMLLAGGSLGLLGFLRRIPTARAEGTDPHFLICVQLAGGLDPSYAFDARPAKLTELGLRQNYLLKNTFDGTALQPNAFSPDLEAARTIACERTGSTALLSPLFADLWTAYKDRFSVINGVHMLAANDGHDGNSRFMWSNAAGSDTPIFPPIVGANIPGMPLESIVLGNLTGSNLSSTYIVRGGASGLGQALAGEPTIDENSPLGRHIIARAEANAQGAGVFSEGSRQLANGLHKSPATARALGSLTYSNTPQLIDGFKSSLSAFDSGLTRVSAIVQNLNIDLHDSVSAQRTTIATYTDIAAQLRACFDLLAQTPYKDGGSYLDHTTVIISSEFGRTNMTSNGGNVGATGSDHNALANSVLIGGKNIVPGLIVGETDLRDVAAQNEYADVSPEHMALDPSLLKVSGKAFDFTTQRTRTDLPAAFKEEEHIGFASVTNTVLDAFGVPQSQMLRKGITISPILTVLRSPS